MLGKPAGASDDGPEDVTDLPDLGDNIVSLLFGYYHGFVAWRGVHPADDPAVERAEHTAYYYIGYVLGWLTKLYAIVFFAQTIVPDVSSALAGTVAVLVPAFARTLLGALGYSP